MQAVSAQCQGSAAMSEMVLFVHLWARGRGRIFEMRNLEHAECSGWQAVYNWLDQVAPKARIIHGVSLGAHVDYIASDGVHIEIRKAFMTGGEV